MPKKLPLSLHKFFWDVDASQVNPGKHPKYVINRLLDKGDLAAARWVLRTMPRSTVVETLKTMRDFSPWNGVFWASYLNIPRKEVKCLEPSYLARRKQLWPF